MAFKLKIQKISLLFFFLFLSLLSFSQHFAPKVRRTFKIGNYECRVIEYYRDSGTGDIKRISDRAEIMFKNREAYSGLLTLTGKHPAVDIEGNIIKFNQFYIGGKDSRDTSFYLLAGTYSFNAKTTINGEDSWEINCNKCMTIYKDEAKNNIEFEVIMKRKKTYKN